MEKKLAEKIEPMLVTLDTHEGNRPILIVWRLKVPMPITVFRHFSVLRDSSLKQAG